MADVENEIKVLKEKNTELVQKVQYWKMTAAQRENEKLDLMKEINDLRLKLSRLRSGGAAHARKLNAALQSASEEALSHLVQASNAVARNLELAKTYKQDVQELDTSLPRWNNLSSTPSSEKINIVPPLLIGGRLIQPVVSLSRTLQSNNSRSVSRSPSETNHRASERAVPLHMLQDVYIPLTRIDARELPVNNADNDMETNGADDSTEDLALDDSTERITDEPRNVEESEDFEESRRLEVVSEDVEPEDDLTPERTRMENPLEGPSWLLDRPTSKRKVKSSMNFEPDSTTEFEDSRMNGEPGPSGSNHTELAGQSLNVGVSICEFSPTVRRRRASPPAASPQYSPRPPRRYSNNGRILKVLVAKMRLDDDVNDVSPPKRSKDDTPKSQKSNPHPPEARRQSAEDSPRFPIREISPSTMLMRFDAPSPNGSTDSRVIVLETNHNQPEPGCSGISKQRTLKRVNSNDSRSCHNNTKEDNSQNRHHNDSQKSQLSDSQSDHHNDSENNHIDDSENRHRNDSENRQHSDSQCDSEIRHQSDNKLSKRQRNNLNRHQSVSQSRRQRDSQIRCQSDNDSQSRDSHNNINVSERNSRDSDSSGSELVSEGRTRRPRKAIVYKEKPLNRKLRR